MNLPTFYSPADFDPQTRPEDRARRAEVITLYGVFFRAGQDDRSQTLERAVYDAVMRAHRDGKYAAVIGPPERPPNQNVVFNGVNSRRRSI